MFFVSSSQELNGMIVQEKIVESKHQKKQVAEVGFSFEVVNRNNRNLFS